MAEGLIDSASAYEVILLLARKKPALSYRMEWDSSLAVTATLINASHVRLAPSPRPEGAASGPYGLLLDRMSDAVSRVVLPDQQAKLALQKTKRWGGENTAKLGALLRDFIDSPGGSPSEASKWLHAHIQHEWHEHVIRRGALFDRNLTAPIAKVLNVQEREVARAWTSSSDSRHVASLSLKQPDSDEFRLIRDSFILSCLLRGRYHDYAAELMSQQLLAHPVREAVYRRSRTDGRISIEISNTERYLANITIASAFSERSHDARVALWLENVLKLRRGRNRINLSQKDRDEIARDAAIEAARRFDVRVHSRLLENVLDVGIGIGTTALTSFALLPWESMIVGSGVYAVSAKKKIGERLMGLITARTRTLSRLSQLGPGRIHGGK